ncbi:sensor histidine kinase [Nesterenkonia muleiensis]|uniref:sensor histidine kinase n=1 Tax=Nesterenkonia muleiensis TaxID=2282648 RepID=UPI000E76E43B|nr:sensor histidine kinase [Nesterenkonia muleiensis]
MKSGLRGLFPTLVGAGRQLHDLEAGQRALSNQRPFLFTVGFVCLVALLISPQVFTDALFLTGVCLTLLSPLPTAVLPWHRFSSLLYWGIPGLQFAAIAALRAGGGDSLVGLSLIAVFPVIWLAWFAKRPLVVHTVTFTASLAIVWIPVFLEDQPLSVQALASPLLIPVILWVVGIFATNVSRSIDARQLELEAKDKELRTAAAESQRHAQLLDIVIETVPVGVVVVDTEGNDVMMNSHQRAQHLLGIPDDVPDPREDQLLVFYRDKKTPVPAADRPVRRAVDGATFTHQLIWLGDEQQGRALSVSATNIQEPSGHSAGSVIVFNDVTEHVAALEAKDDFLHGVTHELRTPLTSILGYIDLALDEVDSSSGSASLRTNLQVAERNATRLLHLVSDLLDTASGPRIAARQGDLAGVIRSSIASARPQADAAEIALIDQTPAVLPGVFDPDRMHQVLDNLISNAIKYSGPGDKVTALAWAQADSLCVRIEDTGRGMTEVDQEQIFNKFFRTSQVHESRIPGLGLGLSITKGIIDAHGGSVSVDSALGRGTAFTVSIPAQDTAAGEETPRAAR